MARNESFRILLACTFLAAGLGVKIKEEGQKVIYLPKGESVKLGCPFTSDPEDNTPDNNWDIQWKQVKPGLLPQDSPLLGYHDHQIIYPGSPDLQKRVGFTSADPSRYDASMQLRDVQITDTATYECIVKKTTEATHKVTITVQERPAVPQCWIIGDVAYGEDVTLRCFASAGSPPLNYRWAMTQGEQFRDWIPPGGSLGSVPGDLHIYNLGDEHVGTYQCSVGNNVGVAYCSVDISLDNGVYRGWIVGGSVLTGLLVLALLIAGMVWWWCCRAGWCPSCYCGEDYCWDCICRCCIRPTKQECMQTKANEICLDADAPPSRPCSQAFSQDSSLRSLLGHRLRSTHYPQGCKYIPPVAQVKMTSSPPDSDTSLVLAPDLLSPHSSEQSDTLDPYYHPKRRDPYSLPGCSRPYVKGESHHDSVSQSHIYSDPQNVSVPSTDPSGVHWNDGAAKQYKGKVVMMQSSSKEGLLI
ncbi:V-set and immunoglobulin domain-containing protein 8 [Pogona vitticeps]